MDRTAKTSRTLFIEQHHEKLQRESRHEAQWSRIMSNPAPRSPAKREASVHAHMMHGHSSHMLLNHHDSHHWGNVSSGGSFDEYSDSIRDSFGSDR